jgi:DNA-binding transcriptional MerR regulator
VTLDMNELPDHEPGKQPAYRIGAAARLTGISAHTLRKWEDRYGMVEPRRSAGGERLYSASDVKRLALVKDLAAGGMSLTELAALSLAELESLVLSSRSPSPEHGAAPPQARVDVVAIGAALPTLLTQDGTRLRRARVVASGADVSAVHAALGERDADVAILERATVTAATAGEVVQAMSDLEVRAAVLVYGFGTRRHLDAMRRPEIALARAPVEPMEIERLCLGLVVSLRDDWPVPVAEQPVPDGAPVTAARWSTETLARVIGMSSSVACECPRHLADLIMSLTAFEEYSAACENREDKDAALHRYLRRTAGASRRLFEDALVRVAEHEGLDID